MQDIQIVAQSIEAGGGRSQAQATALRTIQALIEGIENRQDKKQDEQHPEGQNKQIGGQGLRPQGAGGPLGLGRHVIEWSDLHIHLLVLLSSSDLTSLDWPLTCTSLRGRACERGVLNNTVSPLLNG